MIGQGIHPKMSQVEINISQRKWLSYDYEPIAMLIFSKLLNVGLSMDLNLKILIN